MASVVDICNLALNSLGAESIVSLTQDTENARYCNTFYTQTRDAELRAHPWNFAIKRAQLASTTAPAFGPSHAYPLPTDFLRLMPPDPESNFNSLDWQIEGRNILTHDGGVLEIRYIARITDTTLYDALFIDALVAKLAVRLNEKITQSNSKGQQAREDYIRAIREARRINAFENTAQKMPEDVWITARL